jgi:hypothetical protein
LAVGLFVVDLVVVVVVVVVAGRRKATVGCKSLLVNANKRTQRNNTLIGTTIAIAYQKAK